MNEIEYRKYRDLVIAEILELGKILEIKAEYLDSNDTSIFDCFDRKMSVGECVGKLIGR